MLAEMQPIGQYDAVILVRRWWPIAAFVSLSLALQTILLRNYHARGHATGHLSSATAVFFGSVLIATILWSGAPTRRYPDVWIASVMWIAALVGVAIGNLRVVAAIGGADWSAEEADALGAGRPGFESGHDLAEISMGLAVAAAVVLVVVLLLRSQISRGVAVGAILLSLLFPPWFFPGAGVLVVAIALCVSRHRMFSTRISI